MRRNALSVLVVESEPAIAEALCAALERRGHLTQVVSDSLVALEQENPDVLICGSRSTDEPTYGLLEEFARRGRQPRSILLLSDPNTLSFRRARELGVEDVLARPFRLADLMSSVERISESNTASEAPTFSSYSKSYPCDEEAVQRCARDLAAFALRSGVSPSARARLRARTSRTRRRPRRATPTPRCGSSPACSASPRSWRTCARCARACPAATRASWCSWRWSSAWRTRRATRRGR